MANLIEEKSAMEAINKLKSTDPSQFLTQNPDLSLTSRKASQLLFSFLKPYTPKSPFDCLLTDGFDAEQIWQQIDIQSQPLISSFKRDIKRFEQNPDKISSLLGGIEENEVEFEGFGRNPGKSLSLFGGEEEEFDVGLDGDSEEDEDEEEDDEDGVENESESEGDEEMEDDGDGVPEVEDEFLKVKDLEKFLSKEEKREYEGDENIKNKKKSKKVVNDDDEDDVDEESESDDDMKDGDLSELLMYGGDDNDEDGANIRYEDFYLPNKKPPKSKKKQMDESDGSELEDEQNIVPKRRKKQFDEAVESDELEMDNEDESQDGKNLSTHEKEREKLQAKIKQMEEANLAAKDWTMGGEITASKRPRDSALEVDLDFEHNMRPPPVITEEVTTSLEDIIKKRITEANFDDVQKAPKLPSTAPKERKELDDNKSKKGLAEIYEEEYAKQTGVGTVPLSHNDELRKEASGLFKRLCLKLDALSHFHFAPKPVVEDMSIQTNVPALAMEEIAPVAVSDASMLAPEEVFAGKGDIKEDTELTKEDRKKRRATKKRKFKAIINAGRTENRVAVKTSQDNGEGKEL